MSENFKFWLIIITIIAIIGIGAALTFPKSTPAETHQYIVHVGNWVGSETFTCDKYERTDNTYRFYDNSNNLIKEITITNGYYLEVTKRNQ